MALPDYTTQDPATYKANIDSSVADSLGTLDAKVPTTSGTTVTLSTSIPPGVKRIDIMFNGVSVSGAGKLHIVIGPSAGVELTSYLAMGVSLDNSTTQGMITGTTGFLMTAANTSLATTITGTMTLTLFEESSNTWSMTSTTADTTDIWMHVSSGIKAIAGELTDIALSTAGGTITFDAGSVSISYK